MGKSLPPAAPHGLGPWVDSWFDTRASTHGLTHETARLRQPVAERVELAGRVVRPWHRVWVLAVSQAHETGRRFVGSEVVFRSGAGPAPAVVEGGQGAVDVAQEQTDVLAGVLDPGLGLGGVLSQSGRAAVALAPVLCHQ